MKNTDIGAQLRAAREAMNLSQEELSHRLDIRPSVLAEFEAGTLVMSDDQAKIAAGILGLDPVLLGVDAEIVGKWIPRHFWEMLLPPRTGGTRVSLRDRLHGFLGAFRLRGRRGTVEDQLFHPDRIPAGQPWMYLWIVMFLTAFFLASWATQNIALIDLCLSLIVPIGLLWYLYERHEPRTISGATILFLFLIGGLLAIFAVYYERSVIGYWGIPIVGELITGFVEESAKILIVVLVGIRIRMERPVTGILVGFAVGAGVSAIETMDYGMYFLMDSGNVTVLRDVVLERSFNSLLGIGHHFWTGMVAGGVVAMSANGRIRFDHIFHRVPLFLFTCAVLIHATWNYLAAFDDAQVIGWRYLLRGVSLVLFILVWVTAARRYRIDKERSETAGTPPERESMEIPPLQEGETT
jgi:RsiW-degrading membrane proteinase PrsW (M82 family)/transcriptional regulator with XRE-family HTH domain